MVYGVGGCVFRTQPVVELPVINLRFVYDRDDIGYAKT